MSSLAAAYGMKRSAKHGGADCSMCGGGTCKMAKGGMVDREDHLVDRIMEKRFSKGGMVANETDVAAADEMPAQFDDLVLDDDLSFSETGANSGDELGDAREDEDRRDIVAQVMKKRNKQHNPRPA